MLVGSNEKGNQTGQDLQGVADPVSSPFRCEHLNVNVFFR